MTPEGITMDTRMPAGVTACGGQTGPVVWVQVHP